MGIFFTLVYVLTAYLAPPTIFGDYAQYHLEIIIAVLTLLFTLPSLQGSGISRISQTKAILGLTVAIVLSMIFNGLKSGSLETILDFAPSSIVFFFLVLNFKSKKHLQILVAVLFLFAVYTIYQGAVATFSKMAESPYVLIMTNGEGDRFYRILGNGFLNDPNDLAQFLVALIPCMFFFWKKGNTFANLTLVYLPVAFLLFGMFLTHSRGGMLAILVSVMVISRRKIGIIPGLIAGAIIFAGLSAVGWSGGRDISAETGADRMEAWATGLQLIRSHPIFGVGYLRFTEYFYITAHNSIVVCCAELGIFGFFFWVLLILTTLRDLIVASAPPKPEALPEPQPAAGLYVPFAAGSRFSPAPIQAAMLERRPNLPQPALVAEFQPPPPANPGASPDLAPPDLAPPDPRADPVEDSSEDDKQECRRLCGLVLTSFAGFLTAGWFLSRSYSMVLFVNAGIAAVVARIAQQKGVDLPQLPFSRAARLSAIAAAVLLAVVYVLLRTENRFPT